MRKISFKIKNIHYPCPYPLLYIKQHGKLPPGYRISDSPFPRMIKEALEKARRKKTSYQ